jgi:hypothetical protein
MTSARKSSAMSRDRVEGMRADVDRQIIAIQAELQVLAISPSLQLAISLLSIMRCAQR